MSEMLTIDHILPRALGGADHRSNYQTLCARCNSSKGAVFADYRPQSEAQLTLALEPPRPSLRDRFMAKVSRQDGGCWLWTGARVSTGNGAINVEGRLETAARVSYRLFVGEVPDGLLVYRSCGRSGCVAPDHLVVAARGHGEDSKPQDACDKGHAYTPDNIKIESGRRRCRTCRNATARQYHVRKRAQALAS